MSKAYDQALGMARDYLAYTITLEMMNAPFYFNDDTVIGYSDGIQKYFLIEKDSDNKETTKWGEEEDVRQWLNDIPEPMIIHSFCNQFADDRLNIFEMFEEVLGVWKT